MYLDEDMARIEQALRARIKRGWLAGDPRTLSIRPLGRCRRQYLVQLTADGRRQRWRVDATRPGVVLLPAGDPNEGAERQDMLMASIRRVLSSRLPPLLMRRELAKVRRYARLADFDFPTLLQLATRQLSWPVKEAESLLTDMTENYALEGLARVA